MKHVKENKWDLNFSEFEGVEWDMGDVTYGHFSSKNNNKSSNRTLLAKSAIEDASRQNKRTDGDFLGNEMHT